MLNKILTDNNLVLELLINLQPPRTFDNSWLNSIEITIDADSTATQNIHISGGTGGSTIIPITPSQIQTFTLDPQYWEMGGITEIRLEKNGDMNVGLIKIEFPDVIDSLGMLNRDEVFTTQFYMTGSMNDPSDLADDINNLEENKQNSVGSGSGAPSGGSDGDIYFQTDGNNITGIYQKVNGQWLGYSGGGGGSSALIDVVVEDGIYPTDSQGKATLTKGCYIFSTCADGGNLSGTILKLYGSTNGILGSNSNKRLACCLTSVYADGEITYSGGHWSNSPMAHYKKINFNVRGQALIFGDTTDFGSNTWTMFYSRTIMSQAGRLFMFASINALTFTGADILAQYSEADTEQTESFYLYVVRATGDITFEGSVNLMYINIIMKLNSLVL